MKKNDAMGWIVYILMLGIAAAVGFGMLRPALSEYTMPMNNVLFVVIAVVAGILLSANLLELGHMLGAKMGNYKILKVNILGMQFKKKKDGKFSFSFSFSFDGLTGETMMSPKDPTKSNPRHSIYMPLLFLVLEVAACAAFMVLGIAMENTAWRAAYIFALVVLVIVVLVNVYNIFPAALDSKNDGYLMTILNNKTNVEAYNNLLLASEKMLFGEPVPEMPIYEQVTDFTNSLNQVALYAALGEKNFAKALEINEYTIKSKDKVSSKTYETAVAQKLSINLLVGDFEQAKEEYINLPLSNKKFIAELSTAPSIRAYALVSGLVDESESETKAALDRSDKAIKGSGEEKKNIEMDLIKASIKKISEAHPDWDFSEYSFDGAEPKEKEASVEEEKPQEETPAEEPKGEVKEEEKK